MSRMSPSTTKVTLGSETRQGGMSRGRLAIVGTDIERAILLIITEIVTPKALSECGCRPAMDRDVDDSSGGREGLRSIREGHKKGSIES